MVKARMLDMRRNSAAFNSVFIIVVSFLLTVTGVSCQPGNKNTGVRELDGLKVPEGFTIESVVEQDKIAYPMFAYFDDSGRLFVFESDGSSPKAPEMLANPSFLIRLLEDTDGDGKFDKSSVFADSITYPKGGYFYKGSLYTTSAPDLLRLTDTDGDGVADKREVILTGWTFYSNGSILGGPFFGPDGWMYMTDARRGFDIVTKENKELKGAGARIWRCLPDGSRLESMSGGGFDNTIELVFMPSGETLGTMTYFTDPQAGMRDALMHWVEGGVYPKPHTSIENDRLKLTGELMPVMSKTARVAPAGLVRYRGQAWGKEYEGNLFSAEFNTGRIMRHQLIPDGGTYRTVDEPFIVSTVQDIHLTDVWQDADGSMLVANTGGWFIAGCPLSRVAKLDVRGGIYRIRKTGAAAVKDPRGDELKLSSLLPEALVKHGEDKRPAVRDKVMELLVEAGEPAVAPIKNVLLASSDEELRAAAVFALSRIGTPAAMKELVAALGDQGVIVRTAASRVLGLAKHKEAMEKLMELVQQQAAPVRRQAATALGQIGDPRAIPALIRAAADSNDRFVEHAIIYAMISLNDAGLLRTELGNPSPHARKALLIALDQMDGSHLRKEDLAAFLSSADPQLRHTGIWAATHHPEWADIVISFLGNRLNAADLSGSEKEDIRKLMIVFSGNPQFQHFLAQQLGAAAQPEKIALLLDVVKEADVKTIPATWIAQLAKRLQGNDIAVRAQTLGLIESRNIKELNGQLKSIIGDPAQMKDFRLKALKARLLTDPAVSADEFNMVALSLDSANDSPIRQLAASVLTRAKLSDDQLLDLATKQAAKADVFLLPALISAFQGNGNAAVGEALIQALRQSSDRLDNLSEQDLQNLFKEFPETVRQSATPLMAQLRERHAERLSNLQAIEAGLKTGDVSRGRGLFFGKAVCSTCHEVSREGAHFGPDLTNIGDIRSRHDILEAIVYPNASFAREYETSKIITAGGSYTGIIKEQLPAAIVIETAPGQTVRVQRADITAIEPQNISMMPPGLNKLLTPEELSDLIAYLTSLPDGMGINR
ncbi:MAG: HEAT repeat domain-containing protein [Chitinophagaceae bacterium]|nr:HEAT repeat domain-containing protein [Chitinophagaceae bacterium]